MSDETLLRSHGLRTNIGKLIREDTLDGRKYIVAPVVLITEGVHNNVLYTAAELSKHTDAWNGRPLVAPSHPTVNGRPVTANSKRVLEKMEIGKVLNVNWDAGNKKLRGEAWFDKEKTGAKCPKVLAELEKDAPQVEVSTGLFTDDTMKANVFGNKQYACEAKNHRPDHLAILIGGKGACSWEDGAGLPRINAAMDDDDLDEPTINKGTSDGARKGWETRRGGGEGVITEGSREEVVQAYSEKGMSLRADGWKKLGYVDHRVDKVPGQSAGSEIIGQHSVYAKEGEDTVRLTWEMDATGENGSVTLTPNSSSKNNAFEGGHISDEDDEDPKTCPDCGGELVDGVCPECDGEAYVEEPEKKPAKQNSVMHVLTAIAEKLGIAINRKIDVSAGEKANRVSNALSARYNPAGAGWGPSNTISTPSPWLRDLFDGYAVYEMYGKTFKLSLSWDNGQPVFEGEPVEVVQNTEWVPKNNSDDKWLETEGTWEVPGWEASHNNWDESQPRDEDGKWAGGSSKTASIRKRVSVGDLGGLSKEPSRRAVQLHIAKVATRLDSEEGPLARMYKQDAESVRSVLSLLQGGNTDGARSIFNQMDTAARDHFFDGVKDGSLRKALASTFGVELTR